MKGLPKAIVVSAFAWVSLAASASDVDPAGVTVSHSGSKPSVQGIAQRFMGQVRIDPLFQSNAPSRLSGGMVTFEPGSRTAWHTHPLGQTLIVTSGRG
ncbi:cupin 2 domain-containing protein [Caballeronia turbans]|jgi:quercetin dioxygenase-like cupin family protein|nr:cupin 2 domain-containing protein [Caballeronia turbans]